MKVFQKTVVLKPKPRGFHLATHEIESQLAGSEIPKIGIAHLFCRHTSAGLTLNENADPSVRRDFRAFFDSLAPDDSSRYEHTVEGADDITAHLKTSIVGSDVVVPISGGKFNLGIWQGVYLCEFRYNGGPRTLIATVFGK